MSRTKKNAEEFLNPYHFIPLPEKKTITQKEDSETFTGKITYEIVTKTPLFIPNTSCESAFGNMGEHKSYDFYSYKELKEGEACESTWDPVIPGSEVRGMLRSVYEAVTGSCMSSINADMPIFYRGNMRDFLNPGLLKREGKSVVLIGANAVYWNKKWADQTDYVDGQKLFYFAEEKGRRNYVKGRPSAISRTGAYGYLLRGESGMRKKNVAIFSPVENQIITTFDDIHQKNFRELLEAYKKDSDSYGAYAKEYQKFMEGKKEQYFPVYYKKKYIGRREQVHIAPAAITKWKYNNSVKDLLRDMNPCHMDEKLCPACSLFGMIDSESKQKGIASRLRFADMTLEKVKGMGEVYCEQIDLKELAGPHLSNAQMYLKQPEGMDDWNYDSNAEINGRKFYWHHADWNMEDVKAEKNTERNVTVRPVAEGVTFTGELFFDHLTWKELKQMLCLCDISRSGELGYKLGMGKPLGLGSIEMRIRTVKIRILSPEKDDFYSEKSFDFSEKEINLSNKEQLYDFFNEGMGNSEEQKRTCIISYEQAGFLNENLIKEWFELLMGFGSTKGHTISYPYTDKQLEKMEVEIEDKNGTKKIGGFQWFVVNKGLKGNKQCLVRAERENVRRPPLLKVLDAEAKKYDSEKHGDRKQNYNQNSRNYRNSGRKDWEKRK